MLFDLDTDPQELNDRGAHPLALMLRRGPQSELFHWPHRRMHITTPNTKIAAYAANNCRSRTAC